MSRYSEMCEIIPGLLIGNVADAEDMVLRGADVLVPLAYLRGSIWQTSFRGEVMYYPVEDMKALPDDVLNELVDKICARLDEGKTVGLFCAGGHGRTGYVAGCVLARRGVKDPIGFIRTNYSPKAIETEQQANAVFAYAKGIQPQQISSGGQGKDIPEVGVDIPFGDEDIPYSPEDNLETLMEDMEHAEITRKGGFTCEADEELTYILEKLARGGYNLDEEAVRAQTAIIEEKLKEYRRTG